MLAYSRSLEPCGCCYDENVYLEGSLCPLLRIGDGRHQQCPGEVIRMKAGSAAVFFWESPESMVAPW